MPIAPLLVVVACGGYEALYEKWRRIAPAVNPKYKTLVLSLLLLQLIGSFAWTTGRVAVHIQKYFTETSKYLAIARDLAHLSGLRKIAQSSLDKQTVPYLSYLADVPYAGQIVLERHRSDWLEVLKKGHISHFVALRGELEPADTRELELIYQFHAKSKDFQMFKILYDD
jgi:hypothetical protein